MIMVGRWQRQGVAPLVSILLALALRANAQAPLCSTENTGSGFGPYYDPYQSHAGCSNQCNQYVFAYAIIQGYNCWCSNNAPSSSGASCTYGCPGYDYETCGTPGSAFDYVPLGNPVLGTAGGYGGAPSSSSTPTPTPSTVVSVSTPPPVTTTRVVTGNPIILPAPSTRTKVQSPEQVTSIQRITVNGGVTYVTLTPTPPPQAPSEVHSLPEQTGSPGLSGGAVAGIVIGVLLGLLLLGLAVFFFCCWPRKRRNDTEGSVPTRNSSVLSKVGLLRSNPVEVPPPRAPPASRSAPQIRTHGLGINSGPNSATTGESQMSENRRNSRPLFVDNRLNPNALFEHANASRTSVGTLQDDRDYSRPLEVRNPDR